MNHSRTMNDSVIMLLAKAKELHVQAERQITEAQRLLQSAKAMPTPSASLISDLERSEGRTDSPVETWLDDVRVIARKIIEDMPATSSALLRLAEHQRQLEERIAKLESCEKSTGP